MREKNDCSIIGHMPMESCLAMDTVISGHLELAPCAYLLAFWLALLLACLLPYCWPSCRPAGPATCASLHQTQRP